MTDSPSIEPGTWLRHYRTLTDLERSHAAVMREAGSVKLKLNGARERAKRDGVDMAALKLMNGLSRLSETEATARLEHLQSYLAWSGLPIGTQAALPFIEPDADAVRVHDIWLAECEGRDAVEAGGALEANPYQAGSEHAASWDKGWRSSNPIPVAVAPARKRASRATSGRGRGRPKGSRNKPKADRVLTRLRRAERAPAGSSTASFDF